MILQEQTLAWDSICVQRTNTRIYKPVLDSERLPPSENCNYKTAKSPALSFLFAKKNSTSSFYIPSRRCIEDFVDFKSSYRVVCETSVCFACCQLILLSLITISNVIATDKASKPAFCVLRGLHSRIAVRRSFRSSLMHT